jgi:hypothetical protein
MQQGAPQGPRVFGGRTHDPSALQACFQLPGLEMLAASSLRFRARITGVEIGPLILAEVDEDLPRLARITFPEAPLFVTFPLDLGQPSTWEGLPVAPGQFLLHAPSSRVHCRSFGWSRWGLLAVANDTFAEWSRSFLGPVLMPRRPFSIMSPEPVVARTLIQLHSRIVGLAHAEPEILSGDAVVEALLNEIAEALMDALAVETPPEAGHDAWRHCSALVDTFDHLVMRDPGCPTRKAPLAVTLGVPLDHLSRCCTQITQLTPGAYVRLLQRYRADRRKNGTSCEQLTAKAKC